MYADTVSFIHFCPVPLKCFLYSFQNLGMCIAYHESRYDSNIIGIHREVQHLGVFQISEKWWCRWDKILRTTCNLTCEKVVRNYYVEQNFKLKHKIIAKHFLLYVFEFNFMTELI